MIQNQRHTAELYNEVMTASGLAFFVVLGAIAFFVLVWCFAVWIASWASGWRKLAERFPATFAFTGDTVRFASARIGIANYNGTLIVGTGSEGLYLVPIRIFRFFHPPLLIPWTEITSDPRDSSIMPRVLMTFPSVPGTRIYLYGRSVKQCMPFLRERDSFGISSY